MRINNIFIIKFIHSIIFIIMSICLLYILYCAIARIYDWTLLVALGAIFLEGAALILNHWQCPLTTLAKKCGDPTGTVTDILLPTWCARRTFKVSTVLFAVELILLGFGYFTK